MLEGPVTSKTLLDLVLQGKGIPGELLLGPLQSQLAPPSGLGLGSAVSGHTDNST